MSTKIAFTITALISFSFVSAPAAAQQSYRAPTSDQPCSTPVAAVGGAILGALLGGKKHRLAGAAVGGALGTATCVAVNYHSRKVKSAEQVDRDYAQANGGAIPAHASLVRYDSHFNPVNQITPGGSTSLDSYIEIARGSDGAEPTVEEAMTLISPAGKTVAQFTKPASQGASAGAFETQFALKLPEGVEEGNYELRTSVLLDGQSVRDTKLPLQVVGGGNRVASQ